MASPKVVNIKKGIHCLNFEEHERWGKGRRHGRPTKETSKLFCPAHAKDAPDLNKAMNDAFKWHDQELLGVREEDRAARTLNGLAKRGD